VRRHSPSAPNAPQAPPDRWSQALPDARSQWRAAQDENYYVLLHAATGTVIELVRHSKGWLQCRDYKWQIYMLYPDGHVDCPRVQVLDAEHLITQIRNDQRRSAHVSRGEFGYWKFSQSEHGERAQRVGSESRSIEAPAGGSACLLECWG
jgi:hypothetical protein